MIVSGIPWGSQAEVTCHVEGNVVVLVQGGGVSKQLQNIPAVKYKLRSML